MRLLERDETRRVGSSDTGATVLDRLVWDGELSEVVSDHLRLDLSLNKDNEAYSANECNKFCFVILHFTRTKLETYLVEDLSVVDSDDGSDHLGEDDHVTEVSLDASGLLEDSARLQFHKNKNEITKGCMSWFAYLK